jgi:hypothetical protein
MEIIDLRDDQFWLPQPQPLRPVDRIPDDLSSTSSSSSGSSKTIFCELVEDPIAEGYSFQQHTSCSYKLQLRDAVEIAFFGRRYDVPPDGQCGFYSLLKATIISIQSEGGSDPTLERWNKQGFAGASFFRKSLRSFFDERYIQIVDSSDPVFLDDKGNQNRNFRIKLKDGDEVKNCVKHNGQRCNRVELRADRLYNIDKWQELLESKASYVGDEHWMEPNFSIPLAALKYQRSYIYYNPNGVMTGVDNGFGRSTTVHFYRPDGKVQTFSFDGYRPPFQTPPVGCVWYDGTSHFNYIRIKSNFDDWSDPPTPPQDSNNKQSNTVNENVAQPSHDFSSSNDTATGGLKTEGLTDIDYLVNKKDITEVQRDQQSLAIGKNTFFSLIPFLIILLISVPPMLTVQSKLRQSVLHRSLCQQMIYMTPFAPLCGQPPLSLLFNTTQIHLLPRKRIRW